MLLMVKASDPARLHGAAPSLVIADEVAQWPRTRVDAMLAALRTAMGKIPDSRLVAIGTRASTPSHPFERLLADADFTMTFAARPDDPIGQKRTWLRANPSLRYFPNLERAYRKEVKSAKRDPSLLTTFEALRLNLGVSDTVEPPPDADVWLASEREMPIISNPVWGINLGTSAAMSAVTAYWPENGRMYLHAEHRWDQMLVEAKSVLTMCQDRSNRQAKSPKFLHQPLD